MKYKDPITGEWKTISVKAADTLPIGTEVDYDGDTVPDGWEEIPDPSNYEIDKEILIGKWIDGKPLYRKTLNLQVSAVETVVNHGISIDNVARYYGIKVQSNSAGLVYCIPYLSATYDGYTIEVWVNRTQVGVKLGNKISLNLPLYLTIEYTKTTDVVSDGDHNGGAN